MSELNRMAAADVAFTSQAVAIYLGHSHTGAIFHALNERDRTRHRTSVAHRPFNIWKSNLQLHYFVEIDGRRRLNQAVAAEIEGFKSGHDTVCHVSLFGGNAYNIIGLLKCDPDYDIVLPGGRSQLRTDVQLLPLAMVEARLRIETEPFLEQLTALRLEVGGRILHLQSPPPISDEEFMMNNLDQYFKLGGKRPEIAHPDLRLKLWRLHSAMFAAHCGEIGIEFVPCPPEALTSEGFLATPFWANATHANGAYGELLFRQVEERVGVPG